MAVVSEKKFIIEYFLRSAVGDDAKKIIEYLKKILMESTNLLTTLEEFSLTPEKEREVINQHREHPDFLFLVLWYQQSIVGVIDFSTKKQKRISHGGDFGISIARAHWRKGLGNFLMQELIDWATQNPKIEKIMLSAHATNQPALNLYKKFGFQVEGRRQKDIKMEDGSYVDTILMTKFL